MTALAVRPLLSAAVATLAFGGAALAGAPAAFAVPGDNGDIKIHKGGTEAEGRTDEDDQRNVPKVCVFYLAAFNFDTSTAAHWEISNQPATNGPLLEGDITLTTGKGITDDLVLPDGHYKVTWTWTVDGVEQHGAGKHKVFKVDCEDENGGPTRPPTTRPPHTTKPPHATKPPHHKPPHHKPPHGPVGAGGGGSAELASDGSAFAIGSAIAAAVAGTAGVILIRRSRRRTDGAA